MSREDSPLPTSSFGTLGTLYLVGRKTGADVQSFPIDAERVTIGRDYDCDIRLYFSDVSKLHCEIIFDLQTSKASLHIHGGNGVTYTPSGGSPSHEMPPAILSLSNKDTFMLRKKIFRFEYGTEEVIPGFASPAPAISSPVRPVRRRASHRLSLVPNGKDFVPSSPAKGRRQSLVKTGPSKLSQPIQPEEEIEEEGEEELVDVVEGEGGDRVYLEVKADLDPAPSAHPVFSNAFMTPQQKKRTTIRNTSAVPRTRKLPPVSAEQVNEQPSFKTPRSVPLPLPAETPYVQAPPTPSRVPPKIAMTTPRGDASLRKALLVQSARKVWHETRSPGIEGAIERGDVEVRRKSLSPIVRTPKKSLTPMPSPAKSDDSVSDDETNAEAGKTEDSDLRWVNENDVVEQNASYGSESGEDSLEADMSLDIPGQAVLDFAVADREVAELTPQNVDVLRAQEDMEEDEDERTALETYGEDKDDLIDDEFDEEEEDVVNDMAPALPGTPAAARALSRFYTPQPRRGMGQPRRSLAQISGPAVRFTPVKHSPEDNIQPRTPRSMGPPSRIKSEQTPEERVDQKLEVTQTPARSPGAVADMRAEAQRRRETLATPRALPVPPSTGFRTISRATPGINLMATPSHPALAPTSPSNDDDDVPPTPLNDIRRRLSMLRRDANQGTSRRQTVGAGLPSTPLNRPTAEKNGSYTMAAASRKHVSVPITPMIQPIRGGESEVSSLNHTPTAPGPAPQTTISLQQVLPQRLEDQSNLGESGDSTGIESDTQIGTPSFAGLKQVYHPSVPPATPRFTGLKDMFSIAQPAALPTTPAMDGLRRLLATPPAPPKTPNFVGVREMYQERTVMATPAMDGVADMYELFEGESSDEEESEIVAAVPTPKSKSNRQAASRRRTPAPAIQSEIPQEMGERASSPVSVKSRNGASSRSTSSRTKAATVDGTEVQTKVPAKRGRPPKSVSAPEEVIVTATAPAPAKAIRRKKATTPVESKSVSKLSASKSEDISEEAEIVTRVSPAKRPAGTSRSSRMKVEETSVVVQDPPSKPSRSTSSRSKRATKEDPVVLSSVDEQVVSAAVEQPSTGGKGKKTTTKALSVSTSTSEVAAPAKRSTRKPTESGNKENEPMVEKKVAKRTASSKTKAAVSPVSERVSTRSTRSRK